MFELIAVFISFIGSVIAGFWDLFTTEVPDEVPVLMITLGVFNWFVYAVTTGDAFPLILSLSIGTLLLSFGLILYKTGSWGGADAWLLAAIGYNIPLLGGNIFMIDYVMNFLLVGVIYMVIYSIILGIINKGVFSYFIDDLKKNSRMTISLVMLSMISLLILLALFPGVGLVPVLEIMVMMVFLVFFWRYARIIETRVFRKRIKTSQLRIGDVTEDMLWRGITADEIKKLKRTKSHVVIKEGVRFVPAFAIALVVTILFGNIMFLIL